jgi:MFS family permease
MPVSESENRGTSEMTRPGLTSIGTGSFRGTPPSFRAGDRTVFLWGIPNNLNDVLIRQFMKSFAISRFQAGLVQSAFYMGYFLLAMPAALMMRRVGYKAGFVTGLVLYASGTFLFWPAALVGRYEFFLLALFVIASGLSFLETASNPFIAQLGDPESSERRLNFSQAFNPLGSITGVLIGTIFIFSGVELTPQEVAAQKVQGIYEAYLRTETLRVVRPYLVIGVIALIWAVLILRTKFPSIQSEHENSEGDHGHFLIFRIPALPAGSAGAVLVCRRPGWNLELLYSVCAGVRASTRKGRGIFPDGYTCRFRSGNICVRLPDALHRAQQTHGCLQRRQYRARSRCRIDAWLGRLVVSFPDELLHVADVANYLCPWPEGTWP